MKLQSLLMPRSISVIGASRTPGKVGHEIVANLIKSQFKGDIIPINPTAQDILGITCYPNFKNYKKEKIDLSVIAVPTPLVKQAVHDSIEAGAGAICVITAGFKEASEAGKNMEVEIANTCRSNNVHLLGPNCLGLINTHHHMNASFAKHTPMLGGISVVSQSGAICTAILDWAAERQLGLAKLISMGNKADLNENDFLAELAEDDDTKVIVLYVESIDRGDSFIHAAEMATAKKPVVILKAGVSEAGQRAASSHTGSLAGADFAYGAAFKRSGCIRANDFESLLDYATAFSMQPIPKGRRVAVVTNAGGPGIMAADTIEQSGMTVANLGGSTATRLKDKLPAAASVGNPIDVLGDADPERYAVAIQAALQDEAVDSIVVLLTPQAMTHPAETAMAIAKCVSEEKPILAVFMGGQDVMPGREKLVAHNLPDFLSPERAVRALKAMCEYSEWQNRPARVITRFAVNRRRVNRILSRQKKMRQFQLGEVDAKTILRAYDFSVPEGALVISAAEAVETAKRLGFPVAMKIASYDIIHKSDMGGVRLNLSTPTAVEDAYELMMMRIQKRAPKARLDGVYIERMCPHGLEIILGMTRDPQFGPMLMFGLGGIFVEIMKDVAFHLAPVTSEEALLMLKSTRSYELLKGARGQAAVDLESVARGIQQISQLATDFPEIIELDINPYIIGELTQEPMVADARITLLGGTQEHA